MREDSNVRNAERSLSMVFGEDATLQLVLNGVNKTLSGSCGKGKFFLRLSPDTLHTQLELKHEARLLSFIADNEPSLATRPFPNAMQAGSAFKWDDQVYFGIATTVAPGAAYDESAGELRRFGGALGTLHAIPIAPEIRFERHAPTGVPQSLHGSRLTDEISLVRVILAEWADSGRPVNSARKCICHGDAWPGNGRFSAEAVTLFDFEYASIGDPVADLASVAWWLTGLQRPSHIKTALWATFLDGYAERTAGGASLDLACLPYHVLAVELRSLLFLQDFISLTPDVEDNVRAGSAHMARSWRRRIFPDDGRVKNGW